MILWLIDASYIKESTGVPKCACGGQIKPDVVLYEEGLDDVTMQSAIHFISQAEILIIGGTSLAVYPAAGLIDFYKGNKLVLLMIPRPPRSTPAPRTTSVRWPARTTVCCPASTSATSTAALAAA